MSSTVTISARGEQRVRAGHPWIYRADVVDVSATAGDIVEVIGPRRRRIGDALFSDRSQISIRMLTVGDVAADQALLRARLERAIRFRESLHLDATAYRLVHGEADLLPSLVVDRYDEYLVVQTLSQGMDRLLRCSWSCSRRRASSLATIHASGHSRGCLRVSTSFMATFPTRSW
jgi:23S rRNA (cytosine1962-C5)-methyltransferase